VKKLQVVMPMAGRGQRFIDSGVATPKPLIPVDGKPMFLRSLDSIASLEFDLHIIVRKETEEEYDLSNKIKEYYPDAITEVIESHTRGAAETVMKLRKKVIAHEALLILDCDLFFESLEFVSLIREPSNLPEDGLLLTFDSTDSRYSYVKSVSGIAV